MRLPQLIGLSRALDLILTGRPIKAEEALQLGVANRVAKSGTGGWAGVSVIVFQKNPNVFLQWTVMWSQYSQTR